ncbi:hypothetical protein RHM62_10405 [Actimicrobium sp. CCC2.4]|uniref:hypothetical protein n=1 Tax=Actimicrobium sp. CCC2.4 TaxID=3048606 RepID=UPI002AC98A6E|nr:hypothetical protein [Actimicrobium sp. CCC2.4]WPX30685.1 hypothetical protein RHM62_10405 [Actimicrobium sp. CCC2.4]
MAATAFGDPLFGGLALVYSSVGADSDLCMVTAGLDSAADEAYTMRGTDAMLTDQRTKNVRAVRRLLGHAKLQSTTHQVGIEVDDAFEIAEQMKYHRRPASASPKLRDI